MPVGISKITCPRVKRAFAVNACVMVNPPSSRKSVFMPQMKDEANVDNSESDT